MPATYTPANGDHVTITRRWPNGRTSTWTGTLTNVHHTDHTGWSGYRITGTGPDGQPADTYLAGADAMHHYYGAVQTVTPTRRPTKAPQDLPAANLRGGDTLTLNGRLQTLTRTEIRHDYPGQTLLLHTPSGTREARPDQTFTVHHRTHVPFGPREGLD